MKKQTIYVVAGPTASGKSNWALSLAKDKKGQIVNADAFQVYQDLRVLTARPDISDEQNISHFLYGYADSKTQVNAFDWLKKIQEILPELSCPIVVGGTGLYIHILMNGMSPIPDIPSEIREFVRQMSDEERGKRLKNTECPLDPQRQKRYLEVLLATGKPVSYFQSLPNIHITKADFKPILIQPPREVVYENCEKRLDDMLKNGAIEEVQNLIKHKATGGVIKAIGVPELTRFIQGEISLDEAKNQILLSTRHYAKRQMTWFRHQYPAEQIITEVK